MRRDALAATVAALVAVALGPTACAGPTRSAHSRPATHAVLPVRPQRTVPPLGSYAASVVGGPLMGSSGIVVNQPAGQGMPIPDVPASAWVVASADTGQVLAAKDPHG